MSAFRRRSKLWGREMEFRIIPPLGPGTLRLRFGRGSVRTPDPDSLADAPAILASGVAQCFR